MDRGERLADPGEGGTPWAGDGRPVRVDDGPPATTPKMRGRCCWPIRLDGTEAAHGRGRGPGVPAGVDGVIGSCRLQATSGCSSPTRSTRSSSGGSRRARGDREEIARRIADSARGGRRGPTSPTSDGISVGSRRSLEPSLRPSSPPRRWPRTLTRRHSGCVAAFDTLTAVATIEGLELDAEFAETLGASAAIAVQTDPIPEVRAAAARSRARRRTGHGSESVKALPLRPS